MTEDPAPQARWSRALDDAARSAYHAAHGATGQEQARVRVRWRIDPRTAATAGVVIALLAALGWWGLRPSGEALAASTSSAEPGAPQATASVGASPSPSGAGARETAEAVVVHVSGAVSSPGVVTLPQGARVGDAVDAAGGLGPDADLNSVNLARTLTDGEHVMVASLVTAAAPGASGAPAPATPGLIDINLADAATLEELPGVGPVIAERIVADRVAHGPYATLQDLERVPGVGPAILGSLEGVARVG